MKNKSIFSACAVLFMYGFASAQQSIDAYVLSPNLNSFTLVAGSANSVSSPVDIDFFPNQGTRPFELWILNQGTSSSGGSTVIVSNANKSTRKSKYVKDGNAWHFMALASAIAFGDSFWATSADILDANRSGGKYTGPTLWPSDMSIYGIVGNPSSSAVNGSHLDMVHQSPFGKGIAFEKDLVYWVLDGFDGTLKRYDFVQPHAPGGADHSNAKVHVYSDFSFTKHSSLPGHIVIDADKKYLYGCDPEGKRIFRVDITTGSDNGSLSKVNAEPLAEYRQIVGLTMKDIMTTGLTSPVGIDVYGDRLIITDNGSSELIILDIKDNYKEVGRIKFVYASTPDPMGVKVGPDGRIYFADRQNQKVYMLENPGVYPLKIASIHSEELTIYPNPSNDIFLLKVGNRQDFSVRVINQTGETIFNANCKNSEQTELDLGKTAPGIYNVVVESLHGTVVKKIVKL